MERLRLGKTGLLVSRVGFGGIPIQRLTEQEAIAVVRGCLERGVNFIDTARGYAMSEERIGKALAGRYDEVILATKSPARDKAGLLADLDLSLRLLGVEAIDLYQLHGVSSANDFQRVVGPDGALEGAWEARRAGKIKHIGLSSHSLETATEAVKSGLFETIFFPLNFVTREAGEELYPLALERDVGFMVMKPFAGGMLEDARLAFKYLLQFPQATLVTGIERIEELDEILQIVSEPAPLTEAEKREIDRLREELGNKFCRRCQYCQPCAEGVPITNIMVGESMWKRFALPNFLKIYAGPVDKVVADCTKCGECEEKCPYGLPIREMMDEFLELYHREEARYAAWNH